MLPIQVYELPPSLTLPEKTILQCRWSAYNSEMILHRLLTSPNPVAASSISQHFSVISNPNEADLFFVPLFTSCYLFDCWVKAGWPKVKTPRCGVEEDMILPVMDWIRAQGFWDRRGGADHMIPHPMDYGDGYFTETARSAMNASTHLVTVGDHRPPPFSLHYRHYRDIVIPSATHLLNSYYVNPLDYVDEQGHPRARPIGVADPKAKSVQPKRSEIYLPTPSSGMKSAQSLLARIMPPLLRARAASTRSTQVIFRGGLGRPGEGEAYALSIRSLFFPSPTGNISESPFSSHVHPGFSSLPGWDIALASENDEYARALAQARFGLAPPGYTLDTTRLYEYLAFGVVPVFIGTGPHAGQAMPFERDFDYDTFSIFVPRERAHELPMILARISEEEYEKLRKGVWNVGRQLVIEEGRGNVWKWIVRDMCRMQRIGTGAGPEIANN